MGGPKGQGGRRKHVHIDSFSTIYWVPFLPDLFLGRDRITIDTFCPNLSSVFLSRT